MIAVCFPTDYEAQSFVARMLDVKREVFQEEVPFYRGKISGQDVVVCILGIGNENAMRRARLVVEQWVPSYFILAGFAGGLIPDLRIGQILVAQNYLTEDMMNLIKFISGFDFADVHTSDQLIASAEEKRELGRKTECQVVDMECSGVSLVVQELGAEFVCVRAISDTMDQDLPAEALERGYDIEKAEVTPWKMALYLLSHPLEIKPLLNYLKPLPEVRTQLAQFLVDLIGELV
jgi:adenosylhomocysteine nucleosidase